MPRLPVLPMPLVLGVCVAYLGALFAIAGWADRRARQGRSVIANAWVYALSLGVYCTAWTYFGSVGRAAETGIGFLPIYLGPTLAMVLAWVVLRKLIRVARENRLTSIADAIASRHGQSRALAGVVTLLALVGVVPYVALQLKGIGASLAVLTGRPAGAGVAWYADGTALVALMLAVLTVLYGTRHLDASERHEGLVAAIAAESVVKLLAFVAVGAFVTFGLFDGPADLWQRARAEPALRAVIEPAGETPGGSWVTLVVLAMLSVLMLPRQFQIMVVENVDERHVRRAAWFFPAYLLAINVFVLPLALAGVLTFGPARGAAETFVLSLPLAAGQPALALLAFVGGLSAATGMVIAESIAVSTMVCNALVLPLLLRHPAIRARQDMTGLLKAIRRSVIVALIGLGFVYERVAGEAYALVSIGLISFAAVAQFAPALLGGLFWKGGTRDGALVGLLAGGLVWGYTLMLPSIARSGWLGGWLSPSWLAEGPAGLPWLRPEALFGIGGWDNLSHGLFWSLTLNLVAYVGLSVWRPPRARELTQAVRFVEVFERGGAGRLLWRGRVRMAVLEALLARFVGADRARERFAAHARASGTPDRGDRLADAPAVHMAETQLAGAIGSASARAMIASVASEDVLRPEELQAIVEEARELRHVNARLRSLDRMKDDFIASVTHELRTPLTSIRALVELMRDDPLMPQAQRQAFLDITVTESQRLSRLVNQVLDLAKLESGHADWRHVDVDLTALLQQSVAASAELFRARGAVVELHPCTMPRPLRADPDRLTQVVVNLLSNAARFVPEGTGRVTLRASCDDAGVCVRVADNGPGVPPDQAGTIFERFRQGGPSGARPVTGGTGLGLAISRQIIEHLGGRLWLEPPTGAGATFAFTLPWHHEETRP